MSKINERLEELASNVLLANDMYSIPVDVIRIANFNDIKVYEAKLEKNISGAIRLDKENNKYEILVNSEDSEVRKRFTIAHELGHYFLHKEILESEGTHVDFLYRLEKNDEVLDMEREADYFGGALLMNKIFMMKLRDSYSIKELADMFNVSASAMTVRMDILGIL